MLQRGIGPFRQSLSVIALEGPFEQMKIISYGRFQELYGSDDFVFTGR